MKLKQISVLSLGYVAAVLGFLGALLQAILIWTVLRVPQLATQFTQQIGSYEAYPWALWIVPIFGIIMGFLGGVIFALVYNYIVVKITGGLEITLK